jgi:hypothetical protein
VHVAIDDHTRLAYAEVLPDERVATCAGFLTRAAAWFATRGAIMRQVLTDNAKSYRSSIRSASRDRLLPPAGQLHRPTAELGRLGCARLGVLTGEVGQAADGRVAADAGVGPMVVVGVSFTYMVST